MTTHTHNLDIHMYSLSEVLNLFDLDYDISMDGLKRAKKRVLMMQPDKSKLPPEYFLFYKKAFDMVPVDIYYVISDDIDWCKKEFAKEFPTKRFVFLEESDDLITFCFARLFRNYICANSSFHWWASYLSYYNRKGLGEDVKVVCPKKHFGPSGPQDYADYFRKDMILL